MAAPDPNVAEPPGKLSIAHDPIMSAGRNCPSRWTGPPPGDIRAVDANIAKDGRISIGQLHGDDKAVPGILRVLNITGDLCLSAVTGPYRDIAEIGTGKDMWDDRELTRTEIGVRVGLTFGVPVAGIFLAKAFSVGSKVARAVHRAEQAGETVEEVLESGVRIADRAENVGETVKDAIQPGIRAASDVAPNSVLRKIGHATPWEQMTATERRAFQHSYSRHAQELGLPAWSQKNAEALRKQFNNIVEYIRTNGIKIPNPPKKPFNGQSVNVNFYEVTFNGVRYYYYETLDGIFISAGRSR